MDKDTFDSFYESQYEYQQKLDLLRLDREEGVRRNVLYAIVELTELLNETPWKWHRMGSWGHEDVLAEEWADVLCFVFNIAIHAGLTLEDLRAGIERVLEKNADRLTNGVNK